MGQHSQHHFKFLNAFPEFNNQQRSDNIENYDKNGMEKSGMGKIRKLGVFGEPSNDEPEPSNNEPDLTYDQAFKQLFTDKVFLAPILQNIVEGCKELDLEVIENNIRVIEDAKVNPEVYDSEDSGKKGEAPVHYDVLAPYNGTKDGAYVSFYFDLEMQRENVTEYPIVKRGVYYCCRLISRQIEKLGEESYNRLRPVYSVWIIRNDIPKDLENTIYSISLGGGFIGETQGGSEEAAKLNRQSDLIHLCLIFLSEDLEAAESDNDLIRYLTSVFTRKVTDAASNPYAGYSGKIIGKVDEVMTLEEAVAKKWEIKGRVEGREEGREEVAKKMIADNMPVNAVAQYTGLSLEEIYELQKEIKSTL